MTDAREIIARAVAIARGDTPDGASLASLSAADRDIAELGVRRVTTAGFRILGPDEVDPVTVNRCAEIAKEQADEEDGAEGFLACKVVEDAIRALGRKA